MSSSFAASTCRTTLAPFRQGISPTPRLYAMTRRIKYSKVMGAVGFEPTNPLLVSVVSLLGNQGPLWRDLRILVRYGTWKSAGVRGDCRSVSHSAMTLKRQDSVGAKLDCSAACELRSRVN